MSSTKYAKISICVSVILVIGYVLSFFKEAIIANYFGISSDVDAYTIALTIPVTLFALISVSIQSIVVPLYSNILYNKNKEEANIYICNLISTLSLFSLVIILLCEILASPLVRIFAPGFNDEIHTLATLLLRITLPTILFSVVEKIITGLLHVHKKFVLPSFSVYLLNLCLILSIVYLHAKFGIIAACIGQVLGSVLQLIYLFFIARNYLNYKFVFDIKDVYLVRSLKQSIPILWSISIAEICSIVNKIVASFLFIGSISALGYASKINGVMMTFFISAISTIVYPLYAESSAKGDMKQLNIRVNFTLSVYSLFLFPLILGILYFRYELIDVVFGHGAFDSAAVNVTQSLLGCYCIGLLFMAFRETLTKVFYSLQDTKTPAVNASIGVVINIILNLTLPFFLGVEGLAIATSITAAVISVRLLRQLVNNYDGIDLYLFWKNIKLIIFSGLIMAASIVIVDYRLKELSSIERLIWGALIGFIIYIATAWIFKTPILNEMICMFIKKTRQ